MSLVGHHSDYRALCDRLFVPQLVMRYSVFCLVITAAFLWSLLVPNLVMPAQWFCLVSAVATVTFGPLNALPLYDRRFVFCLILVAAIGFFRNRSWSLASTVLRRVLWFFP
jgi:hypothetical protein